MVETLMKRCEQCGQEFRKPRWSSRKVFAARKFCGPKCQASAATIPVEDRFWSFVSKSDDEGCWEWSGHRDKNGYGTLAISSRPVGAHRVSWTINYGPIPDGLCVLHRCDNPPCVRPDHLFLGTSQDNTIDMIRKNRQVDRRILREIALARESTRGDRHYSRTRPELLARGDRNGSRRHPEKRPRGSDNALAKLSEADVRRIRETYALGGVTQKSLALSYGIGQARVSEIIRRVAWGHVK